MQPIAPPIKPDRVKTLIAIGHLQVEGYSTHSIADGSDAIELTLTGLGQLCGLTADRTHTILTNKNVRALRDRGFDTQAVVELGVIQAVAIPINWVPAILQCLARSGNESAARVLEVLSGLALNQISGDSTGGSFDLVRRISWMEARYGAIEHHGAWSEAVEKYGARNGATEGWARIIYTTLSDRLNSTLTGHETGHWLRLLGCTPETLRSHWTKEHLDSIESVEGHAFILMQRQRLEPLDALTQALTFFDFPVNLDPVRKVTPGAEYKRVRRAAGLSN